MFSFLNKSISDERTLFDFKINSINDEELDLSNYKDKVFLIVNVASNCGFTKQYDDLQKLYELYQDKGLIVLGIPSNQFGGQEPGTEKEIKDFCKTNFNISFPMTSKYDVKGENSHPIYDWAKKTFGNSAIPKWNFHKILVKKDGTIYKTYGSFKKPMSKSILSDIEKLLD